MARCACCDQEISMGEEYYRSFLTKNRCFCSKRCMKEELESLFLDEVIEDWFDENAEVYTEEPENPYDKYGVNEGDFV